jgi:uncharacterized membrane protein
MNSTTFIGHHLSRIVTWLSCPDAIFKRLDRKTNLILPCLLIILGAALRFYDLGAESYWFDEVITVRRAGGSLGSLLVRRYAPIYEILAHFWMQAFGTSEVATRSLSALAGIASIAVMYVVGRQLFGKKVALISTFLMVVSEFQIYHSQDFRYYSLFVLMTLFSFLFYIRALKTKRSTYFVLYVLFSILLFYTHPFGVFALVAQSLYLLLQRARYREARVPWILSQTLILLAIGPRLLPGAEDTLSGTVGVMNWIPDPEIWLPALTVLKYVAADYPSWGALVAGIAFLVIATLVFVVYVGKEQWLASLKGLPAVVQGLPSKANELLLVGCWLLCPIIIPFVLSKVFGPIYLYRYTISAAPAFYLLVGLGIAAVSKVVPEPISLGLLMILIAPGLHEYYVANVKEQWREAAAYVEENATTDDVIAFGPAGGRDAFNWYYRGNLPECEIDRQLENDETIMDALSRCVSGRDHLWLVLREVPRFNRPLTEFLWNRDQELMYLLEKEEFTGVSVYLFALR